MPRLAFEKLPAEKRHQILELAGQEFAQYGFEGASLNRILKAANVSKGAAYYYFDDKVDVFITSLHYFVPQLVSRSEISLEDLTPHSFWPHFASLYVQQFATLFDRPWILHLAKIVQTLSPELRGQPRLAEIVSGIEEQLKILIKRGQDLGLIRTDLPDELVFSIVRGIDQALDQWILDHWTELDLDDIRRLTGQVVDGLQQMLLPRNKSV